MADGDAVDDMVAAWAAARPDLDLTPMATFGRLGRVYVRGSRAIEAVFQQHGLSTGEFDVLAALRRSGGDHSLTPGQLSQTLMLSPAGMTNRLDRLEAAGLVRREPDPESRRSLRVVLTREGLATVDAAVTDHVVNEAQLLGALTQRQQRALDDALRSLLRALEG